MSDTYTVTKRRIPWEASEGAWILPLGRNVHHDSRNRLYPWQRQDRELSSQVWPRHIPILDQAQVGSCTGEEETGALGTGRLWDALSDVQRGVLNQQFAYSIYSDAETIDGDGPYPPNDNGSSGPSAAQAAKNRHMISGYLHCFSLADVLDALEDGPVGVGSNWYSSMDSPDSTGLVSIKKGSYIRGGHEFLCRGKDITKQLIFMDNSWGPSWGFNGTFNMGYSTLTQLLSEQGDATVSLPITAPVPVPVPTPTPADLTLKAAQDTWRAARGI